MKKNNVFYLLLIIIYFSSCKNEKNINSKVNKALNVILDESLLEFKSDHLNKIYDSCTVAYLQKIGFNTNFIFNKKRTLSSLNKIGFNNYNIIYNNYKYININNLKIIKGICCIKEQNDTLQTKISYGILLSNNLIIQNVSFSYYIDNHNNIKLGCEESVDKLLLNQIETLKNSPFFENPCSR